MNGRDHPIMEIGDTKSWFVCPWVGPHDEWFRLVKGVHLSFLVKQWTLFLAQKTQSWSLFFFNPINNWVQVHLCPYLHLVTKGYA